MTELQKTGEERKEFTTDDVGGAGSDLARNIFAVITQRFHSLLNDYDVYTQRYGFHMSQIITYMFMLRIRSLMLRVQEMSSGKKTKLEVQPLKKCNRNHKFHLALKNSNFGAFHLRKQWM